MKSGPKARHPLLNRGGSWRDLLYGRTAKQRAMLPPKPDDLTPDQARVWDRIVPHVPHVCTADGPALRAGVVALAELEELQRRIATDGLTVVRPVIGKGRDGNPVRLFEETIPNPLLKYRDSAHRRFVAFCDRFGLNPQARVRSRIPAPPPPQPADGQSFDDI
jgi:phage terminase small subunit